MTRTRRRAAGAFLQALIQVRSHSSIGGDQAKADPGQNTGGECEQQNPAIHEDAGLARKPEGSPHVEDSDAEKRKEQTHQSPDQRKQNALGEHLSD